MRAGKLKHRIVIKKPATGRDEAGAPNATPTLVAIVRAEVGFASGRERWANEHTVNNYDAVVTVRYRPGLLEDMLIEHEGRTLEIKNIIDPLMNKVELKLLCVDYRGH